MKWIGQHIWSFISRFRSDVYLESLSSSSDTNVLVVDTNGKITKNTSISGGAASTITVADESGSLGYPVFTTSATGDHAPKTDASFLTYNSASGALQANILQAAYIGSTGGLAGVGSCSLSDSDDDADGAKLNFTKNRGGTTASQDGDDIGSITFNSRNDAGTPESITFADIVSEISDATDGQEAGRLSFKVAEYDGALTSGLVLEGDTDANGEVDVTIGAGAASTTTIAGTLTMGSTAAMDNAGLLTVGNQTGITGVGNISSGAWRGTPHVVQYGGTGQTTLADNSLLTGAGVSGIVAESNLTFDGSTLHVTGDLKVSGDSVIFESANADDPIFTLINTSNDTNDPAQMIFKKDRGAAPAVGTNLGEVRFVGEDSGQNTQEYGGFLCEIDVATDGQESGQFGIWVATHDGELQYGLQLTGGDAEDEVDVSIGQGVGSITTIAGKLKTNGAIELGTDTDTTIARSAAGTVTIEGKEIVTVNKVLQQFNLSFTDDIGTTQHYLSWRDQHEASSSSSDTIDTNYLVPANGRVKCVYMRIGNITATSTKTVRVYSQNAGFMESLGEEEVEATSITATGDKFEVFAFYFDDAEHFQAGDSIKVSVQDSVDSGGSQIYHVTAVLEFDYTQMGRTDTGELA